MILEIEKPYSDIIDRVINEGFAHNAYEVVKQSLLLYSKELEYQEQYLVDKAVTIEMNLIENSNEKLISLNDIFK